MRDKIEQLTHYFELLNKEEQNSFLQLLETITRGKTGQAGRITIDQYNAEIEEALAEAEQGETLSHEEVAALSKQW